VSRWRDDTDVDDLIALTALCDDCGAAYFTREDDPAYLCDPCADCRDAHTSALETRLTTIAVTMVQAALARKSEVA
jgi:hypothetical protein